jgi:hypothetical protein
MPSTPSAIPQPASNNGQIPAGVLGFRVHLFGPTAKGIAFFAVSQSGTPFYYTGEALGSTGAPPGPVTDEINYFWGNANNINLPGQPWANVPAIAGFLQTYIYTLIPFPSTGQIVPYTQNQNSAEPYGVNDESITILILMWSMFIASKLAPFGSTNYASVQLGPGDNWIPATNCSVVDVNITDVDPSIDNWYGSQDTGRYGYIVPIYASQVTGGLVYGPFQWLNFISSRNYLPAA